MTSNKKKYKIGLVLGGGGARGFTHLGVYKALEEKGIKPDIISGTSAGAIVGSFLADGKSADETFDILTSKSLFEYSKFKFFKSGLIRLKGLKEDIRNHISVKNIENLKIPLFIAMTNINKGMVEYHTKGDLAQNIIASSSIPVLFTPMEIDGQQFVDGGLFNNLPIEPIRDLCDIIIAVNISPVQEDNEIHNMLDISRRIFELTTHSNTIDSIPMADILIEPKELTKFHLLEADKAKEMFDIGYKAAKKIDFSLLK